jgi:predicted CoA-binding protein
MTIQADTEMERILDHERIAVVGCSTSPGKAAHDIPKYLLEHEYEVIPVNPFAEEVLGRRAYDSLSDIPETVDVVDVFRPSEEVPGIVDETLEREDVQAIWLQLGISHDEAANRAEEAGLAVVQDKCIKVEHRRLY